MKCSFLHPKAEDVQKIVYIIGRKPLGSKVSWDF